MSDLFISVIVPCYNEEEVVDETYNRIKSVLESNNYKNYELLFIDDGSKDKTLEILKNISQNDKNTKIISFSRNFGHQAAVTSGIKNCTGDIALIIDADLQDPPEIFPDMIKKYLEEKCNVVYGVRLTREGETFFKKLTAKMYYRLINFLSDVDLPKDTGDFRLIDKTIIDEFKNLKEKNKYVRGLISWIGFKQCPIYYHRKSRFKGETKYPLIKMLKFAFTSLLYFTKKPLKLAMTTGFISVFIGLCLSVYIIFAKLSQLIYTVPGWASSLVIVIFFGGIQLLSIGVLGEYIGSIFDEVKDRPEYIIAQKVNF